MSIASVVQTTVTVGLQSIGGAVLGGAITNDPHEGGYFHFSPLPGMVIGAVAGPVTCQLAVPVAKNLLSGSGEAILQALPQVAGSVATYGLAAAGGAIFGGILCDTRRSDDYGISAFMGAGAGIMVSPVIFGALKAAMGTAHALVTGTALGSALVIGVCVARSCRR